MGIVLSEIDRTPVLCVLLGLLTPYGHESVYSSYLYSCEGLCDLLMGMNRPVNWIFF